MEKASKAMRIWFLIFGTLLWVGIILAMVYNFFWILYFAGAAMILASITGICPGQILLNRKYSKT